MTAEARAPDAEPTGDASSSPATPPLAIAVDAALLALASVLVRMPSFLASAHLTFDDGVYGSAALAMRDGEVPFRDVFSPQGPAYYPMLRLFDVVGGQSANSPRLFGLVMGVALVLAGYLCALELTDRRGAQIAGGCLALSGSVLWVTGPIAADGPACAFGLAALAVALAYRRHATAVRAVAIGVLAGLGLATKLVMATVGVPILVLMLTPAWPMLRRRRIGATTAAHLAGAAAATFAVVVITTTPYGQSRVIDQYIRYHNDAGEGHRDLLANLVKIAVTIPERNILTVGLAAAALVAGLIRRRHGEQRPGRPAVADHDLPLSDTALMLVWLSLTFAILMIYAPLFRPHLVVAIPPLALLAGMHRPPGKALLALVLVLTPVQLWRDAALLAPAPYRGADAQVAADLGALPDGSWVISDEPGFAWRAGHRIPGDLVDASIHRIETGRITTESIAEAAALPQTCAVQVWSHRYGNLDGLAEALSALDYEVSATYGGDPERVLWVREGC